MLVVGLGAVTTLPPALLDLLRGGGGADAAEEVRRRGAERLQRDVTCHSHAQSRQHVARHSITCQTSPIQRCCCG